MFKLLKPEDKSFLNNSNFVKNAIFYKDMMCFYEAYSKIYERRESLPNFCYVKKDELCLEGICLLIKMYASEFKFETLKLTLDYLKILYYTIAGYAENDEVNGEDIIKEIDEYRLASFKYCDEQREELETKQRDTKKQEKEIKEKLKTSQTLKKNGRVLSVLSIVLLALSILGISAPVLVMNFKPDGIVLFGISIAGVVLGIVLGIILKIVSKKQLNTSSDIVFHTQNLKKSHEVSSQELAVMQAKYYKIYCEKYEYKTCFTEVFSRYSKVLTIDEIISKALKYKMLSYNMVYDVNRLFKTQQKEISEIVSEIENISLGVGCKENFERIYSRICEQDWLYYNSEIRLNFLKRFTDIGERDYDWKLKIAGKKVNPFDVNIREVSREMVAFTSERDRKLITAPLSEFVKTKYFKNLEQLNFKNGYNVDELKKVKANYLNHFFDFKITSSLTNVFYDKKDNQKIRNIEIPLDSLENVPTLVMLKLKLIENLAGLGNSDAGVIRAMSEAIFKDVVYEEKETYTFSEEDIDYPKFTAEKIEEFDDHYVYYVNGEKKIGYKI